MVKYKGQVYDSSRRAIEDADIVDRQCGRHATSDHIGNFYLEVCPDSEGNVTIEVAYPGYRTIRRTIDVTDDTEGRDEYRMARVGEYSLSHDNSALPPSESSGGPSYAWPIVLGVGAVVSGSVALAAWQLGEPSAKEFNRRDECGEKLSGYGSSRCEELYVEATRWQTTASIAAAGAGAFVAIGALILVSEGSERRGIAQGCTVSLLGTGVVCSGRF